VLNDSKKLITPARAILKDEIIKSAIAWKVAFVDNARFDEMNILRASIKVMHIAIEGLEKVPQFLLIDGNRFYPYKDIKHKTIIKGDGLYFSYSPRLQYWQKHFVRVHGEIHTEFPELWLE